MSGPATVLIGMRSKASAERVAQLLRDLVDEALIDGQVLTAAGYADQLANQLRAFGSIDHAGVPRIVVEAVP
jgi:hypothetical protein